jgi:hypothetical protein
MAHVTTFCDEYNIAIECAFMHEWLNYDVYWLIQLKAINADVAFLLFHDEWEMKTFRI